MNERKSIYCSYVDSWYSRSYPIMLWKGAWPIEVFTMPRVHTYIAKVKNMHDHRLPKQAWEQNPVMLLGVWHYEMVYDCKNIYWSSKVMLWSMWSMRIDYFIKISISAKSFHVVTCLTLWKGLRQENIYWSSKGDAMKYVIITYRLKETLRMKPNDTKRSKLECELWILTSNIVPNTK